ncbi:restriction endonuclease [Methanolapillus ohkumae]|uniref:Restriction endonuclease type IV Mrr domain-containing protein n=1 Tax=Methanolapillus ohkumae TaxID=3028298 RepID=A0AA96V5K7_9EURY|nr:hypothetical protein MsAm2_09380 [Methanosarcinaceae archaeon Am2]
MADFSKYLGKEERVLNSVDMKDESLYTSNNPAAAEWKSWTTLVLTNKRFFSLSKRGLSMREFRLEDVVSTGWVYHPQWGRLVGMFLNLIIAAVLLYFTPALVDSLSSFLVGNYSIDASEIVFYVDIVRYFIYIIAALLILGALYDIFAYFFYKRTTFMMSTKDGKEYRFLLRGRRSQMDEFRMSVQDAKDLYLEETENRYFDKMRSVLFNQSNYEFALNNAASQQKSQLSGDSTQRIGGNNAKTISGSSAKSIDGGKTGQISASEVKQLGGEAGDFMSQVKVVFTELGFDITTLQNGKGADMILSGDGQRYAASVIGKERVVTTTDVLEIAEARDFNRCDFGVLVSEGDVSADVRHFAEQKGIKIIDLNEASGVRK